MDRHYWIVSDPPHGDMDLDAASALLGLAKAETRIKLNFTAPEVWLAFPEEDQAAEAATSLEAAGLRVVLVPAMNLLSVPAPAMVTAVSFAQDELVANTGEGDIHLRYHLPIIGSYCKPPPGFTSNDAVSRRQARASTRSTVGLRSTSAYVDELINLGRSRSHLQTLEMLERRTNLDLYFYDGLDVRRISIAEGVAEFSWIDGATRPRTTDDMDFCVAECERLFTDLSLDMRLVNIRPRRRLTVGSPGDASSSRKLFSFGTVGLQGLLASLSPDFADITQFELGSRLAYLLRSERDPAWAEGE